MKLTGRSKKEAENISKNEGKREAIRKVGMLLTDDELENISGGVQAYADSGTSLNIPVRSGAGREFGQISSLKNGISVNTTGQIIYNEMDGITWYEINDPIEGWVKGDFLILQ